MKKTIAFLLILAIVLSFSAFAFAESSSPFEFGYVPQGQSIPTQGKPAGDPYAGIPGLLILLMEDDTIYQFVPINQVTNVEYKDASKFLNEKDKEAFSAAYQEAKAVEGGKLRKAYWFNIPDNYTLDDEHYAKYLFSCDGKDVTVTVNGDPVEVVSVNNRTSYVAKITARGPIAIYNGDIKKIEPQSTPAVAEEKAAAYEALPSTNPDALNQPEKAPAPEAVSSEDPFTGTWYVDQIDVGGGAFVNAAEMGLTMTLIFSDDGTAVLNGMGQEITGTWKVDGDSAVFTAQGMDAIFTPTETGLRGEQNGTEMTFTRETSGTGFVPAEPVAAGSAAEFDGRWKATTIAMEGMSMSYDAANANSSLPILPSDIVIISDGAVAYEGQEPKAFIFTDDGTLVEPEEGNWEPDTYRLLADGTMVYKFMGYMNVYFERAE